MPQFKQVDVFTTEKFKGNPVAVFFDSEHLTDKEKGHISAWTNLSEATFIEPTTKPEADYKVRIFSMEHELPFAGHPTIGTCHALLEAGIIKPKNGKVVQECGAGLVSLEVTDTTPPIFRFKLPYAKRRDLTRQEIAKVTEVLGVSDAIDAAVYNVGPVWLTILLDSAETVLQLDPQEVRLIEVSKDLQVSGIQVIGRYSDHKYETRTFAPLIGVKEDPVCGSGSGATAAFLRDSQKITGTTELSQGAALNRAGKITIEGGDEIFVSGSAVTVIDGNY